MPTENRGAEMEDTHMTLSDCISGQRVAISTMEASVSFLQSLRAVVQRRARMWRRPRTAG